MARRCVSGIQRAAAQRPGLQQAVAPWCFTTACSVIASRHSGVLRPWTSRASSSQPARPSRAPPTPTDRNDVSHWADLGTAGVLCGQRSGCFHLRWRADRVLQAAMHTGTEQLSRRGRRPGERAPGRRPAGLLDRARARLIDAARARGSLPQPGWLAGWRVPQQQAALALHEAPLQPPAGGTAGQAHSLGPPAHSSKHVGGHPGLCLHPTPRPLLACSRCRPAPPPASAPASPASSAA